MSGAPLLHDARGVPLRRATAPRRIVSLVPSTTETVCALGLGARLVGVTRYCRHPRAELASVARVGGTKDPDLAAIAALAPDLILANLEENRPGQFAALQAIAPLWVAFPRDVDGALADLAAMGALLDAPARAAEFAARVEAARAALRARRAAGRPFRHAVLVWRDPWMAAGPDTWVSGLLAEAGGINVIAGREPRYGAVGLDALRAAAPDLIVLPDEPFPFAARHLPEFAELAPRCRLVDGEALTWHGVRLLAGLELAGSLVPPA